MIAVLVHKLHVARTEINGVAVFSLDEQPVGCGLLGSGIHGSPLFRHSRLVAIEQVHGLSDFRTDRAAIHRGIDILLPVGQGGQLVLVVAHAGPQFPVPVALGQQMGIETQDKALVFQRTSVHPVVFHAGEETQLMVGQQVVRPALIHVELHVQAVVQEIQVCAEVEAAGRLPLQLRVPDVAQHQAVRPSLVEDALEIGTRGIIRDAVVAAHVEAHAEARVVHARHVEPTLVAQHPSGLDTREHAPAHPAEFEPLLGFLAETRGAFHGQVAFHEVTLAVVVTRLPVPRDGSPAVAGTGRLLVLRVVDERGLVAAGVVPQLGVHLVTVVHVAEAAHQVDAVRPILVLPHELRVACDGVLRGVH